MNYIELTPSPQLRAYVRTMWYAAGPALKSGRERMLPSGCAHVVVGLARDFLTECVEGRPDQRTAPVLMVGQRSRYDLLPLLMRWNWPASCLNPALFRCSLGTAPISSATSMSHSTNFAPVSQKPCAAACLRSPLRKPGSAAWGPACSNFSICRRSVGNYNYIRP